MSTANVIPSPESQSWQAVGVRDLLFVGRGFSRENGSRKQAGL